MKQWRCHWCISKNWFISVLFLCIFKFETTDFPTNLTIPRNLPPATSYSMQNLVIGLSVAITLLIVVLLFCLVNCQLQKRKRELQRKYDHQYEMMLKKKTKESEKWYVALLPWQHRIFEILCIWYFLDEEENKQPLSNFLRAFRSFLSNFLRAFRSFFKQLS